MIGLAMMLAAAQSPALSDEARFDLSCTRAASWGIGRTPKGSETWISYTIVNYYFLGRLSGREPAPNWVAIALAETRKGGRTDIDLQTDLSKCLAALNDNLAAGLLQP